MNEGMKALNGCFPVVETSDSGDGDTRDVTTRSFWVQVAERYECPTGAVWKLVGLGVAHPTRDRFHSERCVIERKIGHNKYRCRVEYEPSE